MKKEMSNDEFFKKYEAYEKESIEDFIRRYSSTESELRETIAYLIEHRQMMKDVEIEKLEAEAEKPFEIATGLSPLAMTGRTGASACQL